jgi:hypothetical protein
MIREPRSRRSWIVVGLPGLLVALLLATFVCIFRSGWRPPTVVSYSSPTDLSWDYEFSQSLDSGPLDQARLEGLFRDGSPQEAVRSKEPVTVRGLFFYDGRGEEWLGIWSSGQLSNLRKHSTIKIESKKLDQGDGSSAPDKGRTRRE